MALTIVTAPAVEPLTAAECKSHSRIDTSADDTLLGTYIKAARIYAEETLLGRQLITATWDWILDKFPSGLEPLYPPRPPLQSVTSITYTDEDGDEQTWSSAEYTVDTDSEPGRIVPAYDEVYPTTRNVINAVTVRFKAGHGDAATDVPEPSRQLIRFIVALWHEYREPIVDGRAVHNVSRTIDSLRWSQCVWRPV